MNFFEAAPPGSSNKTLKLMDMVLMNTFLAGTNRNGYGSLRLCMAIVHAGRILKRSGKRNQTPAVHKRQGVLDAFHREKKRLNVEGNTERWSGRLGTVDFNTHKLVLYRGAACEEIRNPLSLSPYWREIQNASGS